MLIGNAELDPSFDAAKFSDDQVLDAVRLYRRIDLWGEGFDYFDYKRWKIPERETEYNDLVN